MARKTVKSGDGMYETNIEIIDLKNSSDLKCLKFIGPKNLFKRHIQRFRKLATTIIESNNDKKLKTAAGQLLDEADLLEACAIGPTKFDQYFIVNQAMLCMSLYHQCAGRSFFEKSFFSGEAQKVGHKNRSTTFQERANLVCKRAKQIEGKKKKSPSLLQMAKILVKDEELNETLGAAGFKKSGKTGLYLSEETIRKILAK